MRDYMIDREEIYRMKHGEPNVLVAFLYVAGIFGLAILGAAIL